jgi:hypothetical protein
VVPDIVRAFHAISGLGGDEKYQREGLLELSELVRKSIERFRDRCHDIRHIDFTPEDVIEGSRLGDDLELLWKTYKGIHHE